MKIGVLSDSHGEVRIVQRALSVLRSMQVGLAIHCGDIGREVAPLLNGLRTHFVPGNTDNLEHLRGEIVDLEHKLHDQLGTLEIEGRRVAFLHGDDVKLLRHTIHSGHWDLVCHGHTHAFSSSVEGRTLVVNPGALAQTTQPSLAVIDLPSMEVTRIPL
jgi:uncharacterized protein